MARSFVMGLCVVAVIILGITLNVQGDDAKKADLLKRAEVFYGAAMLGDEREMWNMRDWASAFFEANGAYQKVTVEVRGNQIKLSDLKVTIENEIFGETLARVVLISSLGAHKKVWCHGLVWIYKEGDWYWHQIFLADDIYCETKSK